MQSTFSRRAFVAALGMLSVPLIAFGQSRDEKKKEAEKKKEEKKAENKDDKEEKKEEAKDKAEDKADDRDKPGNDRARDRRRTTGARNEAFGGRSPEETHSPRSVIAGSTEAARRAGT